MAQSLDNLSLFPDALVNPLYFFSSNILSCQLSIDSKSAFAILFIIEQLFCSLFVEKKEVLLISLLATLPIHLMIRCPKHSVLLPASVNIPLPELILLQISLLKSQLQQEAILQRL